MALSGAKSEQASLGQFGSVFVDSIGDVIPPDDMIFSAIQFLSDNNFTKLESEFGTTVNKTRFFNTVEAAHDETGGSETADAGSGGDQLASANRFPAGITIYGRWSKFAIAADVSGGVIAYLAPKH